MASPRPTTNKEAMLLCENLELLSKCTPMTSTLSKLVKVDMFQQKNKPALSHILHFLLPILKPTVFKTRQVLWPVNSMKDEAQFRREVEQFLNKHEYCTPFVVPKRLAYILLSGAGINLIKFLLDLSTYCLEFIISKKDKGIGKFLILLNGLDPQAASATMAKFSKEQDAKLAEGRELLNSMRSFEEEAKKEAEKLEEEHEILLAQVASFSEELGFDSNVLYNENVERLNRDLDERENSCGLRLAKLSEFKLVLNELSAIVQRVVLSKDDEVVLDGLEINKEELMSAMSTLVESNFLETPLDLYKNEKLDMNEYLKLLHAMSKKLCSSYEKLSGVSNGEMEALVEKYTVMVKELTQRYESLSNLEDSCESTMVEIQKEIEEIEKELFSDDDDVNDNNDDDNNDDDDDKPPKKVNFENVYAPSPKIKLSQLLSDSDDDDNDEEYEFAIDSPFVQRYKNKLLAQLRAQKESTGTPQSRQHPSTTEGPLLSTSQKQNTSQSSSAKSQLDLRRNACDRRRRNLGSSTPLESEGAGTSSTSAGTTEPLPIPSQDQSTPQSSTAKSQSDLRRNACDTRRRILGSSTPLESDGTGSAPERDSDADNWSPRGIFRLDNSNIGEDVERDVARLSEHFAPRPPPGQRLSFNALVERYKNLKTLLNKQSDEKTDLLVDFN